MEGKWTERVAIWLNFIFALMVESRFHSSRPFKVVLFVCVFCCSITHAQDGRHPAVQGDHSSEERAAEVSVHTR